jgi:hypothetical protein
MVAMLPDSSLDLWRLCHNLGGVSGNGFLATLEVREAPVYGRGAVPPTFPGARFVVRRQYLVQYLGKFG